MNILLTNFCNGRCPYCFALDTMNRFKTRIKPKEFSLKNFKTVLDYLYQEDPRQSIRLLGGEPTLYSRLDEIITLILNKGFSSIEFFSNGIISPSTKEVLKKYLKYIYFVWNINPPDIYSPAINKIIENSIRDLHSQQCAIGFNIYHSDYNPDFIFKILNKNRFLSSIRIGIAHPIGNSIRFLKQEAIYIEEYPRVGLIITRFVKKIIKEHPYIKHIELDCGYTRCLFTKKQRQYLKKTTIFKLHNTCEKQLIAILPDLSIMPCFATAFYKEPLKLTDFQNIFQVKEYNKARWTISRKYLPYPHQKCSKCLFKNKCSRGCGGERIILAKTKIKKWLSDLIKQNLSSFKKISLLFRIGKMYVGIYDYENAKKYLNITLKKLKDANLKNKIDKKKYEIFNKKVNKIIININDILNPKKYIYLPEKLANKIEKTKRKLKLIKNKHLIKNDETAILPYTILINEVCSQMKTNTQRSSYQLEQFTKQLKKWGKKEIKEYLCTMKVFRFKTRNKAIVFNHAKILKVFSGEKESNKYLKDYLRRNPKAINFW